MCFFSFQMGVIVWGGGGILLEKEVSVVGKSFPFSNKEEFKDFIKSYDSTELATLGHIIAEAEDDARYTRDDLRRMVKAGKQEMEQNIEAYIAQMKEGEGEEDAETLLSRLDL